MLEREIFRKLVFLLAAWAVLNSTAQARPDEEEELPQAWQENDVVFPGAPKAENFLSFYVSPTADNRFFIDSASIGVGSDGVVRYTLIVDTPGGVRNVTYEGIRCASKEKRLYASGRPDGSWSRARSARWDRITDATTNRQHAALYVEYFCPVGMPVASVRDAIVALKKGSHFLVTPNRAWP